MSYQRRKIRVGKVVGDKMDKTRIVEVEWRSFHRVYKKSVRRRTRFKVHDENNITRSGDVVAIVESRPMSKTKRWRLVEIVERRESPAIQSEDIAMTGGLGIDAVLSPSGEQPSDQEELHDPDAVAGDQEDPAAGIESADETEPRAIDAEQEAPSDGAEEIGRLQREDAVAQEESTSSMEAVAEIEPVETPSDRGEVSDETEVVGKTEHEDVTVRLDADEGSSAEEDSSDDPVRADSEDLQSASIASPPDSEDDAREHTASPSVAPSAQSNEETVQGESRPSDGSAADQSQEEKPRP